MKTNFFCGVKIHNLFCIMNVYRNLYLWCFVPFETRTLYFLPTKDFRSNDVTMFVLCFKSLVNFYSIKLWFSFGYDDNATEVVTLLQFSVSTSSAQTFSIKFYINFAFRFHFDRIWLKHNHQSLSQSHSSIQCIFIDVFRNSKIQILRCHSNRPTLLFKGNI